MNDIVYYSDDNYLGEGISLGIARGILVKNKNINIVQEGTGIGNLALKNKLKTYFSSTCKTTQISETQFRKIFLVDSIMLWQINKKPSNFLSGVIDLLCQGYMLFPGLQNKLLKTGTFFRYLFRLTPQIKKIAPVAEACFNYFIESDEIIVECEINSMAGYLDKVYILNELGADYFPNGIINGKTVPAPSGWENIAKGFDLTALYNPENGLYFLIKKIDIKTPVPYEVFWGREKTKDYSWSGFEIECECRNKNMKRFSCSYAVKVNDRGENFES